MLEIWRILKPEGTVWVNLGDSYNTNQAGTPNYGGGVGANKHYQDFKSIPKKRAKAEFPDKCLMLIPHRFAIDCIDNGWILRNNIIWAKPNSMPESIKDRFSKKHEFMFFFVKQQKYYFDLDSVKENVKQSSIQRYKKGWAGNEQRSYLNGTKQNNLSNFFGKIDNPTTKNCGDVSEFWEIPTKPSSNEHYASYNIDLIKKPILAGCPPNGIIYDPFMGSGTTAIAALHYDRKFMGSEANQSYFNMSVKNIQTKISSTPNKLFLSHSNP